MNKLQLSDLNLHDVGNQIQLTGAVYSGNGQQFLVIFPEEHGQDFSQANLLEMSHADWEKFLKQTDYLETEMRTVDEATGKLIRAVVRKSQRQVDQNISWSVFRRDGYRCRYCGRGDVPLTVDHLVLWEEGGPTTEANLVSACKNCNRTRGNTPYVDWLTHPHYLKVSRNLDSVKRYENSALVQTLDKIERVKFKRSR